MTHQERSHLRGIVAIWMTNGNKPVDGGNDTRYDFYDGGWMEAAEATTSLIEDGFLSSTEVNDEGDYDISRVEPTAKGIFEAIS